MRSTTGWRGTQQMPSIPSGTRGNTRERGFSTRLRVRDLLVEALHIRYSSWLTAQTRFLAKQPSCRSTGDEGQLDQPGTSAGEMLTFMLSEIDL